MEDKGKYFFPGELVIVKHDIPNKPVMWVFSKDSVSKDNEQPVFLGVTCYWFDKNTVLQKQRFSTKDLIHYE